MLVYYLSLLLILTHRLVLVQFNSLLLELLTLQVLQPLVVVLGSSRTQLALNPGAVEREPGSPLVFNYGLAGAHPAFLHVGYHRLRDAGVFE